MNHYYFFQLNYFENHEICLWLSNDIELNKKIEYETIIRHYGGVVVQNPSESTFCIVVDKLTLKVKVKYVFNL